MPSVDEGVQLDESGLTRVEELAGSVCVGLIDRTVRLDHLGPPVSAAAAVASSAAAAPLAFGLGGVCALLDERLLLLAGRARALEVRVQLILFRDG